MLIDWFTVVAQIVNFLVLVALLKRFLFGRIVQAIDEREARIEKQVKGAEEKYSAAERQMEQVCARASELDENREAMLVQAQAEADEQRREMLEKAREEVKRLEAQWREALEREQAVFFEELG